MKKLIKLGIIIMCVSLFASCGKKEDAVVDTISETEDVTQEQEEAEETEEPTPEPTEDLSGKAKNELTGLYIDEVAAARRPVAIVINNLKKALPQSGISQADIIYEVLAEGDITRLVAVFKDFDSKKIGPVRSARDYFIDFAYDHDALFVHHGGSPQAYSDIKKYKTQDLDGMKDASTFWRDPERYKIASMIEHSSYTNAENILRDWAGKNYRLDMPEEFETPFDFYEEPTPPSNSIASTKATVPYSSSYTRVFAYDDETKTYKVFQGNNKHIDEEANCQLEITNVIVQNASVKLVSGDSAGRRTVKIVDKGNGILFTNGAYVPITWEKSSRESRTKWFDSEGNRLTLNKGKTWINVFDGKVSIDLLEDAEAEENN